MPSLERRVGLFAEVDYSFGSGPLRMTVEHIDWAKPFLQDGEPWFEVYGQELSEDGRVIRRRQALVRGRRLTAWRAP